MLIEADHFHGLLEHVTNQAPDLLTACRWLACGPDFAPLILDEQLPEPSPGDLAHLIRVLGRAPLDARETGQALLDANDRLVAGVDVALELLIAAGEQEWSHPTEILGRPCRSFSRLLDACQERLESTDGEPCPHLESVEEKLERAVRIEANARRRRAGSNFRVLEPGGRHEVAQGSHPG